MTLTNADHTALSDAIEAGDLTAVKALIHQHPELVDHPDWTPPPIHCAVLWNQLAITEFLLDNGANIELRDPDRQTTPLRYAIMYCMSDMISLLLSRGANAGPIIENGSSAIQLAREAASGAFEEFDDLPPRKEYRRIVEILLQAIEG